MWDDEINKKIKEAADQYHPAYDENAWDKMELLLNKHLPSATKRKRKYLFILLISLLVGGSLFVVYKKITPTSKNTEATLVKNNVEGTRLPNQKPSTSEEDISATQLPEKSVNTINVTNQSNRKKIDQQLNNDVYKTRETKTNKAFVNATGRRTVKSNGKTSATLSSGEIGKETDEVKNTVENSVTNQQQNTEKKDASSEKVATIVNTPDIKEEIAKEKEDITNNKVSAKNKNTKESGTKKKPTANKRFGNNFAIDFSAGPDASSAGLAKPGKIAINYGVGFSYGLTGRFTLRTGFYIAEKIYSADKSQYHVPSGGSNVEYLYNIDANCKVYEMPLTLSYDFGKVKNHQWFASTGLSSYLMKKESYDYYYKYPNGGQYTKSWSISNQNKNYFSVLDFSAGYEYTFSKRSSLVAEPYVKIPLSGVGAGKVKLNSGGILFTFKLKPFYKK